MFTYKILVKQASSVINRAEVKPTFKTCLLFFLIEAVYKIKNKPYLSKLIISDNSNVFHKAQMILFPFSC